MRVGVTVVTAPKGSVHAGVTIVAAPKGSIHSRIAVVAVPKGEEPHVLGVLSTISPSGTRRHSRRREIILLEARTQESKNGPASSGLHLKLDPRYKMPWEILREKNRGMATERTWNVPVSPWNCPEGLQKGPRKAPGTKLGPTLSPLPPTHLPNGAWGSRADLLPQLDGVTPPKGEGQEGEGGSTSGHKSHACMLSDHHDEASR